MLCVDDSLGVASDLDFEVLFSRLKSHVLARQYNRHSFVRLLNFSRQMSLSRSDVSVDAISDETEEDRDGGM